MNVSSSSKDHVDSLPVIREICAVPYCSSSNVFVSTKSRTGVTRDLLQKLINGHAFLADWEGGNERIIDWRKESA